MINAQEIANHERYPAHVRCGGECTLHPRPDIATRLFYVCHGCGLPVADTAVAFPETANGR